MPRNTCAVTSTVRLRTKLHAILWELPFWIVYLFWTLYPSVASPDVIYNKVPFNVKEISLVYGSR